MNPEVFIISYKLSLSIIFAALKIDTIDDNWYAFHSALNFSGKLLSNQYCINPNNLNVQERFSYNNMSQFRFTDISNLTMASKVSVALYGNPSQSYGALWNRTLLPLLTQVNAPLLMLSQNGWVGLNGWLHTEMVYLLVTSFQVDNQPLRRTTLSIETNSITIAAPNRRHTEVRAISQDVIEPIHGRKWQSENRTLKGCRLQRTVVENE